MTEKELASAADRWIEQHEDELVHDLIGAVNIKSVSVPGEGGYAMGLGCKKCADYMLNLAESYGFETRNDDYYCVSALYPGAANCELGILGHMDVVPEGSGWNYEPYDAIEKDGFVIGRGSSDNKGPTVMSLYVLRCMRDLGIKLSHAVRLIVGFNEEAGMQDVTHYLQHNTPPTYTLICDGGWAMCIGEKGILTANLVLPIHDGNLVEIHGGVASNSVPEVASATFTDVSPEKLSALAQKYPELAIQAELRRVTITARGKAAHAFTPHMGENAIYKLLNAVCDIKLAEGDACEKLETLRQCFIDDWGTGLAINFTDELSGKTTCIGGMIRMENGCLIQNINVRYAITQVSEELLNGLRLHCTKQEIVLENLEYSGPRYTSPELSTTKLLLDTCHEFLPERYEPYVMGGGTHARKFPNALPYGPGLMSFNNPFGSPHGIDEAVCIQHLKQAVKVYIIALLRLDDHFMKLTLQQGCDSCVENIRTEEEK